MRRRLRSSLRRFRRSGGFPTAENQCIQRFDRAIESIWRLESASPLVAATGRRMIHLKKVRQVDYSFGSPSLPQLKKLPAFDSSTGTHRLR
jgi:hypothetical protein